MIQKHKPLKRKIILLTAMLFCALAFTKAQNGFNQIYYSDRPSMRFASVLNADSFYYVTGVTVNKVAPFYAQSLFVKLGLTGQLVNYKAYPDTTSLTTGLFWNSLAFTKRGRVSYSGYGFDTTQHLVFGFTSNQFDSIDLYRYSTPNTYAFQGIKMLEYNDGNFYVTGVHTENLPGNSNVLLAKIDSAGNRIWEKYYDTGSYNYAKSICETLSGNLVIGAEKNDKNQTNEKSNTWLLEVDTGGNLVRQWFDPSDSTYVAEGLRQTQDGGFIYGAQKKNYQSGFSSVSYNASIVKLDSNFNKQWTFIKGGNDLSIYSGITDIEELPDGSFVAAGHLTYYGTDTALNGYVVKLDEDGNVIWERNYRGINESQTLNFLSDIDILPGGGLIAVGQCQKSGATPPQVGWFLKLDSNGCEVENCLLGIDEEPRARKLKIYPNPAHDQVIIELPEYMENANCSVSDINGANMNAEIFSGSSTLLDVSGWSSGVYVVVVRKNGRFMRAKFIVE